MIKKFIIFLIELYQKTLSPDHGWLKIYHPAGYCKFYPSCSEYMKQSVEKKGILVGLAKGFYRILRCNPWSKGGVDPVL
jgi:hypothetical protein